MTDRYAVVDINTLIVVNVIIWDGVSTWSPGEGYIAVLGEFANIGDIYNPEDGSFTPPE